MVKMNKQIEELKEQVMAKQLQIDKFQTEAKEMTNMGPLKSTLEHLEFCLNEKTEEFLEL